MNQSVVDIGPSYYLNTWSNQGELSFWVMEVKLSILKLDSPNFDYPLLWGGGGGAC